MVRAPRRSRRRREGTGPRDAKRFLARAIVERFHDPGAARAAEAHFDRLFVDRGVPEEIDPFGVPSAPDPVHMPALIAEAFGHSRSEARRMLGAGAVRLDGVVLGELDVPAAGLEGVVLQVGKRGFRRLHLV